MDQAAARTSVSHQVVFRDGFGERRRIVNPIGTEEFDVLCLRGELTAVPSFEFSLRERVSRLAGFRHAYFARVRTVERLSDPGQTLALISDATPGVRLSELLQNAERHHVVLDINAGLCLIRQLVPAMAALHEYAGDAAHGALAPERVVMTPNARLVIVEHVMGAAVEQLRFSHERYWKDLRIPCPRATSLPVMDQRADVMQLGMVALALIVGRPVREGEYPARIAEVLASAWAMSPRGDLEPVPAGLRSWLARALQLDQRDAFASTAEAQEELDKVLGDGDYLAAPSAVQDFLHRYHASADATTAAPSHRTTTPVVAPKPVVPEPVARQIAPEPVVPPVVPPAAPPPVTQERFTGQLIAPQPVRSTPVAQRLAPELIASPPVFIAPKSVQPEPVAERPAPEPVAPRPVAPERFAAEFIAPQPLAPPPVAPRPFAPEPPSTRIGLAAASVNRSVETGRAPRVETPSTLETARAPRVDTPSTLETARPHRVDTPSTFEAARTPRIETLTAFETTRTPRPETFPPFETPRASRVETSSANTLLAHAAKEPTEMPSRARKRGPNRVVVAAVAGVVLVLVAGGGTLAARRYLLPAPVTTGTLAVNTSPSGAQVVLDGQPQGLTPTTLTVKAGAHVLELRGAGDPRTISINVPAGAQLSQYIELSKGQLAAGSLQIRTEPTGIRVTVDGVPRGTSPLTVADLAPGEHSVVVEGEGGSTKHTVTIEAGATATLVAQLQGNQGGPASGWISVSAPRSVQLFENGHLLGTSDTDRLMVPVGTHQLDVVNEALGYRTTKSVQVAAGKVSPIKIEFPKGTIALNAVPWAEVWIDGEKVGETPIGNLPVTIGSHEVIFRHPDLGEQRHVTTVTLGAPARLSVDMKKP